MKGRESELNDPLYGLPLKGVSKGSFRHEQKRLIIVTLLIIIEFFYSFRMGPYRHDYYCVLYLRFEGASAVTLYVAAGGSGGSNCLRNY